MERVMFGLLGWKPRGCEVEKNMWGRTRTGWAMNKYPGCWGYIREYTTQLCGDYTKRITSIIQDITRIPIEQPVFPCFWHFVRVLWGWCLNVTSDSNVTGGFKKVTVLNHLTQLDFPEAFTPWRLSLRSSPCTLEVSWKKTQRINRGLTTTTTTTTTTTSMVIITDGYEYQSKVTWCLTMGGILWHLRNGAQMGGFLYLLKIHKNGQLVRTSTFATPPKKGGKTRGIHRIRLSSWDFQRSHSRGRRDFGSILGIIFFEVKKGKFPILPLLQLAVRPWKVGFWRLVSFWEGLLSGAMLVVGSVPAQD